MMPQVAVMSGRNRPRKRPDVPDWFRYLKPEALLSTRDVVALFGFACDTALGNAVTEGRFPPNDTKIRQKKFWRVDTITKEIKRRKDLAEVLAN